MKGFQLILIEMRCDDSAHSVMYDIEHSVHVLDRVDSNAIDLVGDVLLEVSEHLRQLVEHLRVVMSARLRLGDKDET